MGVSAGGRPPGAAIFEAAPGIHGVDLWERGRPNRTSGYLLAAPRPALVEAGPARSVPVWLRALEALGVAPDEVAYVVLTHIHLDHAGGAAVLLRHLARARVVVHRRGARHLVDPGRLVAGARQVFGDALEAYFGLPEPAPEARLLVPEEGRELDLGGGHRLRFLDAPGHARHQHMVLDAGTGSLFSGDELGDRLPAIADDYVLPDTPPTQFDPAAMRRSAEMLLELGPEAVLMSHFGRWPAGREALSRRLGEQVEAFARLGCAGDLALPWEEVHARLEEHVRRDLAARGVAWTAAVKQEMAEHLEAWAKGIADYHERRSRPG